MPPAANTLFFFGQNDSPNPNNIDVSQFQSFVPVVGAIMNFTITDLVPGNTAWLVSPTAVEVDELRQLIQGVPNDDILNQWAKNEDIIEVGGGNADTYQRGPISQASGGSSISYRVSFVAGA